MPTPRAYAYAVKVTDPTPGWTLGRSRVVPRGYSVFVFLRGTIVLELLPSETVIDTSTAWIELEVVSSALEPPRCVALRAPSGISTPELRFPLAGIVTEATAQIASKDGTFTDTPSDLEYGDMVFEANRARGPRKRTRHAITPERLAEVARIAEENPRKPTEAVRQHFGFSRGYARKLITLAEGASPTAIE